MVAEWDPEEPQTVLDAWVPALVTEVFRTAIDPKNCLNFLSELFSQYLFFFFFFKCSMFF